MQNDNLITEEIRQMSQALSEARERAYKIHQALGIPVAVLHDGKVVSKLPSELLELEKTGST
jgi:hypothetical protein